MNNIKRTLLASAFTVCALPSHAALVDEVIFKLSDSTLPASAIDALDGWSNPGGHNEGNAAAKLLVDNGLDYKSTVIDTWPTDMVNVRVAMYLGGIQRAYIDFNPVGTTSGNFFALANVVDSNWVDMNTSGHNFFSIPGDPQYNRHWFVNSNYGGCAVDVGHMVVSDNTQAATPGPVCSWEQGLGSRAFLYANASDDQNWTTGDIGVADVFAVIATFDRETSTVSAPSVLALLGLPLLVAANAKRRRAQAISLESPQGA